MDNSKLTISLLLVAFLLIIVTLVTLRKNKINVKFAIIWFIPAIAIALLALLPNLFIKFAQLFGFQTISNLIIGFILVLILFLIMSLTVIITGLSKKNVLLIQEISLLKKEVEEMGILSAADEQAETLIKGLLQDSIPKKYEIQIKK